MRPMNASGSAISTSMRWPADSVATVWPAPTFSLTSTATSAIDPSRGDRSVVYSSCDLASSSLFSSEPTWAAAPSYSARAAS